MATKTNGFWSAAVWMLVVAGLAAQAPTPAPARPAAPQQPTFRVQIEAVTQDVVVRDDKGVFIPDLKQSDFEILEDGIKQQITQMTMVAGGRVTNLLAAPPAAPPEGLILPPTRHVSDTSGRIFLFFVDDLQIAFQNTIRVRNLFKKVAKELVHEGDLFGIVSSGPSSIQQDMTYDRKRLDEAIDKMTGDGLKPSEVINLPSGTNGPSEIRYRAHVAFETMADALTNLEKVHDRRKALVWVSGGYDFIPFQEARLGMMPTDSPFLQNQGAQTQNQIIAQSQKQCADDDVSCKDQPFDPTNPANNPDAGQRQNETFADADLALELAEITRSANRANTTIYTVDPRGLVGPSDLDEPVDPMQWNHFVQKTQDTLRDLAEETGGIAVVNSNDYDKAFKRIDNDTSDYYILGYTSSNPDSSHRARKVVVNVLRKGAVVAQSRTEYVMKGPQINTRPVPQPPTAATPPAGAPPASGTPPRR